MTMASSPLKSSVGLKLKLLEQLFLKSLGLNSALNATFNCVRALIPTTNLTSKTFEEK